MAGNLSTLLINVQKERFRLQAIKGEKNQVKKIRMISLAIIIGVFTLIMAGYCFSIAYGLGYLKQSQVVPGYALTISGLVTLFFTFLKTNGVLFAAKDYEFLMALPIPTRTIVAAKFLSMYINNLLFCILVMLPMAVGYHFWNPLSLDMLLMWFIGILFAPLVPMTIAAFVGMCVLSVGARFKHKAFVQIILSALLLVVVFGGSFWMQEQSMQDTDAMLAMLSSIGDQISGIIHQIYPLSALFDEGVNKGQIGSFFLFIAISIILFSVFAYVCGKNYRAIHTRLNSHEKRSNYKIGELKRSSVYMALANKEAKRFFSSSLYMLNIGIGLIMALLAAVASLFVGVDKLIEGIDISNIEVIKPVITTVLPFAIAMMVNMCNTTAVSLSLEGKNLWIIQSLPMSNRIIMEGKMLFNIILVLPVSIVSSILFGIALRIPIGLLGLYFLFSITSVWFSTNLGAWVNLHFPNYDWDNEVEVIKQGMGSMIGIFSSMIFYLAMGAGAFALSKQLSGGWILLLASIILAILGFGLYRRVICSKSLQKKI